jgi:hypothetical protein
VVPGKLYALATRPIAKEESADGERQPEFTTGKLFSFL